MGKILESYFDIAKTKGGIIFQVKLAMITKMSKKKAYEAPDSDENIRMFEEAMKNL